VTTGHYPGRGRIVHGEHEIPVCYAYDTLFESPLLQDEWFGTISDTDPAAMFPLVSANEVELVTEDGRVGRILLRERNPDGSWSFQGTGPFPA
jgi:hypothetical protein